MPAGILVNRYVYEQVRDLLVEKISAGVWRPGMALPSEGEIAVSFGVSAGTVRKALRMLEDEHIITRRQGKGTFINDPASDSSAIRLIRIHSPDGERLWGTVKATEIVEAPASEQEREKLNLRDVDKVYRISRLRLRDDRPFIWEEATVPADKFRGLPEKSELAHGIYSIAQHFGQIIGRCEEQIRVAPASSKIAEVLAIPSSSPVAVLDRVVHGIDGSHLEWRVAWCDLSANYYRVVL